MAKELSDEKDISKEKLAELLGNVNNVLTHVPSLFEKFSGVLHQYPAPKGYSEKMYELAQGLANNSPEYKNKSNLTPR